MTTLAKWVLAMNSRQRWSCQVDKHTAKKYKAYFKENDIYFEPSEFYDLVHISFDVSEEELKSLDDWIRKELFR